MDKERRFYLLMITLFNLAVGLSNIFINIFLWKVTSSLTILAFYSLVISIAILISFPLCAIYARKKSPMDCLRFGIIFLIIAYTVVLLFKQNSVNHILEIGTLIGIGTSLFVIGQHMQTLDSTDNNNRDKFLFLSSFCSNGSNMIAPLISGCIIQSIQGMSGFYLVFFISIILFVLSIFVSIKLKGKKVDAESHFLEVWRNPSNEWRGMFWLSIGTSMVEGTYSTFLVTIMSFSILKNELSLGGYNTFVALIGLITAIILAKFSTPRRRLPIFSLGALMLSISSIYISFNPTFSSLVIYALTSTIGLNLIYTIFDSWTYASIEADIEYEKRRLDYIVIREIPLGTGRLLGIVLFLLLQTYFQNRILSISFSLFGSIFLLLIPALKKIWLQERITHSR
jgi:Major Facilitator Superfamily.